MLMFRTVLSVLSVGCLVACGESKAPIAPVTPAPDFDPKAPTAADGEPSASEADLLGHDRLARAIGGRLDNLPPNSAALEKLLGVGRACSNERSREIFVIEEFSKRTGGVQQWVASALPRVVITGCNPDFSDPNGALQSANLMLAMTSDNIKRPADDPLMADEVSAIALDDVTGLYNFYKFLPSKFSRFTKMPDGKVHEVSKVRGQAISSQKAKDGVCYKCHALEEPILAALRYPWDGWVTDDVPVLHRVDWTGETRAILEAGGALRAGASSRSVASQLERTVRIGIKASIEGNSPAGLGYGRSVLTSKRPGGLAGLFRSVFCENTVNLVSATESSFPMEVVADPEAIGSISLDFINLVPPKDAAGDYLPQLFPVRSEADRAVEVFLRKEGYLTDAIALAIRLIDPLNDIFSTSRCGLLSTATEQLPQSPTDAAAHIRKVLTDYVVRTPHYEDSLRNYLNALLSPAPDASAIAGLREVYVQKALRSTVSDAHLLIDSASGHRELAARTSLRQQRAKALFPGDSHPLPPFNAPVFH